MTFLYYQSDISVMDILETLQIFSKIQEQLNSRISENLSQEVINNIANSERNTFSLELVDFLEFTELCHLT